ncbi:MAG TPA: hypothetical protein VFP23_01655 [Solirubrobacterales bacterium]|nr:hypothetical protein [Solirubrobacterales bacterium]
MKENAITHLFSYAGFGVSLLSLLLQLHLGALLTAFILGLATGAIGLYAALRILDRRR